MMSDEKALMKKRMERKQLERDGMNTRKKAHKKNSAEIRDSIYQAATELGMNENGFFARLELLEKLLEALHVPSHVEPLEWVEALVGHCDTLAELSLGTAIRAGSLDSAWRIIRLRKPPKPMPSLPGHYYTADGSILCVKPSFGDSYVVSGGTLVEDYDWWDVGEGRVLRVLTAEAAQALLTSQ